MPTASSTTRAASPFTIDFTAGQYGYLVPASELIQQYWQKIGITVPLKVLEWNTYIQQVVVKRDYAASFAWWIAPFDPDVYPYFSCSSGRSARTSRTTATRSSTT